MIALGYLILSFVHVHDYDLALWHGGYAWVAIATALLLAALAHPAARLGGIIGRPALLWLGLRSYSFYLWHWPVLAMTRPGVDIDLPRGILIPLQLLACLVLADLSYRFVELPFNGKAKLPRMPDGWLRVARPALIVARPRRDPDRRLERHRQGRQHEPGADGGRLDRDLRPRQREAAGRRRPAAAPTAAAAERPAPAKSTRARKRKPAPRQALAADRHARRLGDDRRRGQPRRSGSARASRWTPRSAARPTNSSRSSRRSSAGATTRRRW